MPKTFPELDAMAGELIAIRHDFHQHPELSMQEERTSRIIAEKLRGWGLEDVTAGVGRYGVVAVIHGTRAPSDACVGLRADFDALPIVEKTGLPWASTVPGRMHGCGHDGHAATLLGVARYLHMKRAAFAGSVACIFQPAEEGVGGAQSGAQAMIEDGLFARWPIQEVYAYHQFPPLAAGTCGVRPGYYQASVDTFTITVHGKGGHGAHPDATVDPVVIAQQLIGALQTIVSRNLPATQAGVVTVGGIAGGSVSAGNVIPDDLSMCGTVRTFEAATRDLIERRIGTICRGIGIAFECTIDLKYERQTPSTYNAPEQTADVIRILKGVFGEGCVQEELPRWMGGEDFAFMLEQRPGTLIRVGNSDETHQAKGHNPCFDFNDRILVPAATAMASVALGRLAALNARR